MKKRALLLGLGPLLAAPCFATSQFLLVTPLPAGPRAPAFFELSRVLVDGANFDLRATAISAGWDQVLPLRASITVPAGVVVGSSSTAQAAFLAVGFYPADSSLTLTLAGEVLGMGGAGGDAGQPGQAGGAALHVNLPTQLALSGVLAGGGGGGAGSVTEGYDNVIAGGAGGGGGQGFAPSRGGARAVTINGDYEYPFAVKGNNGGRASFGFGGAGVSSGSYPNAYAAPWHARSGNGGSGGGWGLPGKDSTRGTYYLTSDVGQYRVGGAAGPSIVGSAMVTITGSAIPLGPRVP